MHICAYVEVIRRMNDIKFFYCENCYHVSESDICAYCGASARPAKDGDMCLLVELNTVWAESLQHIYQNNGVVCFAFPSEFMSSRDATAYRIYVPFEFWQQAVDLYLSMLGESEGEGDNIIGQTVTVTVDRPLGSVHPDYPDLYYPVNYGYIENLMGGDGDWQDAYILGVDEPLESFTGKVIAVAVRKDDNESKLVVAPDGVEFSKEEIARQINFQEKYFNTVILTE